MNEKPCCKPCCPPHCQNDQLAYALYFQPSVLSNDAPFDGVALSEIGAESIGDFFSDGSTIQILKPGVYLVTYTIHLPASTAVDTTFALQANRQNIPSTVRTVTKTATGSTSSITAQAILETNTPVALRLSSSSQITITGTANETLASLAITQLVSCS